MDAPGFRTDSRAGRFACSERMVDLTVPPSTGTVGLRARVQLVEFRKPRLNVNMLGQLNPCGGGDLIPLLQQKLLIGRRSSCDITLRFPNVSSHHCELVFENGYWRIKDLGSTNGIKVNGERCEKRWLDPGDVIHVAKHLFKIEYEPGSEVRPRDVEEEEDVFAEGLLEKAGLARRAEDRERRPSTAGPEIIVQESGDDDVLDVDAWLTQDDEQRGG